ncbi:hypothetical protein BU17DRAFT_51599, partial [Hysterangium stoloniferum]
CNGASLVSSSTLHVHDYGLAQTTHRCQGALQPRENLPNGTCATNVCCTKCEFFVSSNGLLPPLTEDCLAIERSISILANSTRLTFYVPPFHMFALSYRTCAYYVKNLDTSVLEYCYSDLSTHGRDSADACFPPHQPFFSEGLCTGKDGKWAVVCALLMDTAYHLGLTLIFQRRT